MCLWNYQCIGRREKKHMVKVHLKIRRLQSRWQIRSLSARVFRNPTAGDALPFYVRCPSIFSSEIALRATHPLPGSSDKSASRTPDGRLIFPSDCWGKEPSCRGTRVLVGQFFSWNSGWYSCVSHESNSRTREEEQNGFVIQRTVYVFCSCFLTIHSRRDVACFHSVVYDEKFDGFSISLTRFSTRESFRFLRIFRFAKHCFVYVFEQTYIQFTSSFLGILSLIKCSFCFYYYLLIKITHVCNCRSL